MRRALLLALVAVAVAAPAAHAAPFTPAMQYAYNLAVKHWRGPPAGCASIDFEIVEPPLGEEFLGEATIPTEGEHIACFMYVISELAQFNLFERMCAVVMHETGHLEGLSHSEDPRSIMYAGITHIPGECQRAGLVVMNHPHRYYPRPQ